MKHIGLWGPSSSGKTVWLAQLYLRLERMKTDWKIYSVTDETQKFVELMRGIMVDRRSFPLGTGETGGAKIEYEFQHPDYPEKLRLFTEDRAGAVSERLGEDDLKAFEEASGLMVLLDLDRENYGSEVRRALERLYLHARGSQRDGDARPVVFCVSKADKRIQNYDDYQMALERPDEFARRQIDPDLIEFVARFCPRHTYFPVSAAGVQLDFGLVRPAVYYDERLTLRLLPEGLPVHLLTPFEWLFKAIR